jgi:hypothetical protein
MYIMCVVEFTQETEKRALGWAGTGPFFCPDCTRRVAPYGPCPLSGLTLHTEDPENNTQEQNEEREQR